MAQVSPARRAAFRILLAVERGSSHADDLLRGPAVEAISAADRNLATALALGVLRWQIRLDHQLRALLTRPNVKLDPEIRIALRLGAFQLLHLDRVPAHAAIDESVELAKQSGHRFAARMVNAVLRKLTRLPRAEKETPQSGEEFPQSQGERVSGSRPSQGTTSKPVLSAAEGVPQPPPAEAGALAPGENASASLEAHPAWMVERWVSFYGREAAEAICRHDQREPALWLRLAGPAVEAELGAAGVALAPGELVTAARGIISGDLAATEAFRAGRARLQDEGSQLVAELACAAPGQNVKSLLDACAAPGGKTLILAERNPEARIVALESSAPRLEGLRKRLAFLGDRVEYRLADATALSEDPGFDLVLVDAPCSGTGTLGRNPEIRHRLRPDDIARQSERQRAILASALRAVRPGGCAVYSTCSLEPEENEQAVAAVLAGCAQARLVSLEARIEALRGEGILTPGGAERLRAALTPEGCLRLLPGTFHTDGFFIALIERFA